MAAITPSATTTVNSATVSGAVAVAESSTVNLALNSTAGVRSVSYTVYGNSDSSLSNPTITPGSNSAASFTMPTGGAQGYGIETVVNNGVDTSGRVVAGYKFRFIVGVVGANGLVPGVLGEKLERGTYGHLPLINAASSPLLVPNAQTGTTYTLTASDNGKLVTLTNASPITLTFPENSTETLPIGFNCGILQGGAGQVTVAKEGSDVIDSADDYVKLRTQASPGWLWKRGTGDIVLTGDLTS